MAPYLSAYAQLFASLVNQFSQLLFQWWSVLFLAYHLFLHIFN